MLFGPPVSSISRVLLAEDSRTCQDFVRIVLERSGLKVDVVWNGAAAIEALSKEDYALVLMDCLMPVMDGIEATRLIRAGSTTARDPEIPIIAITANALQSNAEACKLAGMNDYLTKPVSAATLREVVQKWLAAGPQFAAAISMTSEFCI